MVILLPVLVLLLAAITLVILRFARPDFKYPWLIAAIGATMAFIGLFFWHIRFPASISLPPWQPATVFLFAPTWLADEVSWPYALSLAALAVAVIYSSVVRAENDPAAWAGTLILTALGILAASAGNPLTLVLTWSALDILELIIMLRSTEGEGQNSSIVVAFAARLAGTAMVLWASTVSAASNTPMDFRSLPSKVGIYLLLAAGLRLGVLPLHLPYHKENTLRRGFGTILRLVSAGASLPLLARIPAGAMKSSLPPYLLILAAFAALYAGWMWLRSSDEILGRPFWVLGIASLSVAASLRADPLGSTGWGIALLLSGGLIFLYSARQRSLLWLPYLGLWGLTALPFSPSASGWLTGNQNSWLFILPFLPAQALMMAGLIRHTLHPGETSFESQERWAKALYPAGLFLLAATATLLGLWGWGGARTVGIWWASFATIVVAAGFTTLALKLITRITPGSSASQWTRILRLEWFYAALGAIFRYVRRITETVTSALEGEGGLLWSFLLLVLILSLLSTVGK
jgi:hypothetical protein